MPRVFLSYSHDSEEHRKKVLGLAERLRDDGIEAWLDQYENGTPAQGWPRWMLDQLDAADFVLVVSTETYYRRFRGREVASKGKGADWEGALITQEIYDAKSRATKFVPVTLSAGQETFIPEPLRGVTFYELTSESRYADLLDFLRGRAGVEPRPLGSAVVAPRKRAEPLTFEGPARRVAPTRLTHTAGRLFGREDELARLDAAWNDPRINVLTLVAWGGVGKTALVATWAATLAARDHDGADCFDWSFYSQGTKDQGAASADPFIEAALRFFDDEVTADSEKSPWDKGARLARLVGERRALLILDGLEALQHPPGPLAGELKDPAIGALLKGLAARNEGLCVVTTRESIEDLAAFRGSTAPEWKLEHLSTPAGVELLKHHGVHGAAADLEELVVDVKGHALTLNLIGRYLMRAHGGDVQRRDRVKLEKADRDRHASQVMDAYETWPRPHASPRTLLVSHNEAWIPFGEHADFQVASSRAPLSLCASCRSEIPVGQRFCTACGSRALLDGNQVKPESDRPSRYTFLLNLILVGLAQVVLGQTGKGIVFFLVACLGFVLERPPTIVGSLVAMIASMIDADQVAAKMRRGEPVGRWHFFPGEP